MQHIIPYRPESCRNVVVYRARGEVELAGNPFVTQPFQLGHLENSLLLRRKQVDRLADLGEALIFFAGRLLAQVAEEFFFRTDEKRFVFQQPEALIPGQYENVIIGRIYFTDLPAICPKRQKGILHNIFRQLCIPQIPACGAVDPRRETIIQYPEGRFVASGNQLQQFPVNMCISTRQLVFRI